MQVLTCKLTFCYFVPNRKLSRSTHHSPLTCQCLPWLQRAEGSTSCHRPVIERTCPAGGGWVKILAQASQDPSWNFRMFAGAHKGDKETLILVKRDPRKGGGKAPGLLTTLISMGRPGLSNSLHSLSSNLPNVHNF